ncbi:MAG: hypothetical protein WKG07_44120 [Hymenobacter sp.]
MARLQRPRAVTRAAAWCWATGARGHRPGGQWAVRSAWFEDVLNYRDQGRRQRLAGAHHPGPGRATRRRSGARASLRLGLEAQHFAALVDGYGSEPITENRAAAFLRSCATTRALPWRLSTNLRQGMALPAGLAPLTPTVGLEWDVYQPAASATDSPTPAQRPGLTLKASAARAPTAPLPSTSAIGGPAATPTRWAEAGGGYEVGLRHRLRPAAHLALETELTAFYQLVDNWVQWR